MKTYLWSLAALFALVLSGCDAGTAEPQPGPPGEPTTAEPGTADDLDAREFGREVGEKSREIGREAREIGQEITQEAKEFGRGVKEGFDTNDTPQTDAPANDTPK